MSPVAPRHRSRGPHSRPGTAPRCDAGRRRGRRRGLCRPRRRGRALPVRRRRHGRHERAPGPPGRARPWLVVRFRPGRAAGQRYGFRATATGTPTRVCGTTPPSCSSTPMPRPSTARFAGVRRSTATSSTKGWHGDGELLSDLDSRADMPRVRRHRRPLRLGGRRPPNRSRSESVIYEAHVRNQTALHPGVPEELRGTYAGLAHPASVAHLTEPRRHGRRAAAGARLHPRAAPRAPGHDQPLGLQHARLLRTARRLRRGRPTPRASSTSSRAWSSCSTGRASRSSSTSSTTTPPSRTAPARRCRGAAWTSAPTTASTSAAATSTSPAAATPSTCATPSSAAWCSTRCATGCRSTTSTASASTSPWHWAAAAATSSTPTTRSSSPCAPTRCSRRQAHRRAVGPRHARLAHRPVPPAVHGVERPLPRRRPALLGRRRARPGPRPALGTGSRTSPPGSPARATCSATATAAPTASVNFVAAHDGFTIADLVAYDHKHNEANGEDNRDGSDGNGSWNHGVEGPTDDPTCSPPAPRPCATCSAPCCCRPASR